MSIEVFSERVFAVMDKILAHFAGPLMAQEMKLAKSEFFDNAGILEEHSDQFELRMSQFFDWYFFTRELSGYGLTPLEACFMPRELRFDEEESQLIESLKSHRHSLFEFIKVKNGDVIVKDLLNNEKMAIWSGQFTFGFNRDEIFEARLIPFNGQWIFSKGFCFHPKDAQKYILSEVKRHRKDADLDPESMILKLIKMRYKSERYRHVKIDMIYSNDSKVGG